MPYAYANNGGMTGATSAGVGNGNTLSQAIMLVYSKEILFWAQPVLKYDQFAVKKLELGVTPGLTMNMLRYNNLTPGGTLVEGTRMTTQPLTASQIPITVAEKGNAVSVSELLLHVSFDDVMASAAKLLGFDMAKVLDAELRDAYYGCTNVVYANGRANRNSLVDGDVLNTALIKDGVETLKTNDVPQLAGGYYVCFAHPHQLRGLRDDAAWISAQHYGAPENLFNGEVGRYEDTIFIESTMTKNGRPVGANPNYNTFGYDATLDKAQTSTLSVSSAVYAANMFGDNAVGHAISLPVEMRDNGITDFGREHGLAYYSIWGTGRVTDVNICRLETA
jgi:N4-gp56 family major capsid protein